MVVVVVTNGVSSQWDPRILVRTHPLNKRSRARAQSYGIRISYLRPVQPQLADNQFKHTFSAITTVAVAQVEDKKFGLRNFVRVPEIFGLRGGS